MISLVGFLFSLIVSNSLIENPYHFEIRGGEFNFEYVKGGGKATSLKLNQFESENINLEIEKNGYDFTLRFLGDINKEYVFQEVPSSVLDIDKILLKKLDISYQGPLKLSFSKIQLNSKNQDKTFHLFNLICQGDFKSDNLKTKIIQGCLKKMNLNLGEYLNQENDPVAKDLSLLVQDGKYTAETVVDFGLSGKLKSSGNITYNESLDRMILKVNEIKLGYFNIMDEAFDLFKSHESSHLKIQKPYIYILFTEE